MCGADDQLLYFPMLGELHGGPGLLVPLHGPSTLRVVVLATTKNDVGLGVVGRILEWG